MERKIRPIYEALDGRQPKQALKLCDALLKKGTFHLVMALKAVALAARRMARSEVADRPVIGNWQALIDHLLQLGPVLVALNVAVLLVGIGLARALGLRHGIGRAMAIELGTQNATLGITLGALIATTGGVFSGYALPSAVYGVTMYLVMAPFVAWWRWRARPAA